MIEAKHDDWMNQFSWTHITLINQANWINQATYQKNLNEIVQVVILVSNPIPTYIVSAINYSPLYKCFLVNSN